MIKIDKNVPMPVTARDRQNSYPFAKMKKGDSFYIERGNRNIEHVRQSVLSSARQWRQKHNEKIKFTTKVDGDGVRLWRVE